MTDPPTLTLQNKQRLMIPLVCLPIVTLLFVPFFLLIDMNDVEPAQFALGISSFILLFGWLIISAWRAPFEASIGPTITIRKLMREKSYRHEMVRRWRFLHPNALPSQEAPAVHGLIEIKLNDGTTFKAEVNHEQAQRAMKWLNRA